MKSQQGNLFIVSTPIGNLQDMTPRAIQTLQRVDLIAAEDTRHSRKLTQHFAIETPMIALHEHNERGAVDALLAKLKAGTHIALISDAGTPLISDPGYILVNAAREQQIDIVPIPGPCALVVALSISGLPTDRFVFEGFLPAKPSARRSQLSNLTKEQRTMVFYESPHRIIDFLQDVAEIFTPEQWVVLGRELTKAYETVMIGPVKDLLEDFAQNSNKIKGEMVVILKGCEPENRPASEDESLAHILDQLLVELPLKQAVKLAVNITGHKKNSVYKLAVERSKSLE